MTPSPVVPGAGLAVLAVDDEAPALDDLTYLLARQETVGHVVAACDATEALRLLRATDFDVVLLDIRMPGLDGMDLARVLARFDRPPAVIFVSAFDQHAVEAFEVRAVDYLLKPVGEIRLRRALERVRREPSGPTGGPGGDPAGGRAGGLTGGRAGGLAVGLGGGPTEGLASGPAVGPGGGGAGDRLAGGPTGGPSGGHRANPGVRADASNTGGAGAPSAAGVAPVGVGVGTAGDDGLAVVPVDHGDRVLLVERDRVIFVEAAGDYVRLHTADAHYLVRLSLAMLEERWARHGFVRIHRQYLVAARHISELRTDGGANPTVVVLGRELPVSRRHSREVREVLVRSRRRVASAR